MTKFNATEMSYYSYISTIEKRSISPRERDYEGVYLIPVDQKDSLGNFIPLPRFKEDFSRDGDLYVLGKPEKKESASKSDRDAIKDELKVLGVEFKGNAKTSVLAELLADAKGE